jgi:OmpA family
MTAKKQDVFHKHSSAFFYCIKSVAIALILFASFNAQAGKWKPAQIRTAPVDTIISGIVKDINGKPIANAKITSSVAADVYTNSDGLFSITLQTAALIPHSLFFSYDTLMPVVRSYHPVMENAIYEIVLEPKKCCLRELWGLLCDHKKELRLPTVNFKNNSAQLSKDTKALLDSIANTLKDNPELTLTVTAYPAQSDPKQRVSDKRLLSISEYLSEQSGISTDRIIIEKKPGEGEGNSIDFKAE